MMIINSTRHELLKFKKAADRAVFNSHLMLTLCVPEVLVPVGSLRAAAVEPDRSVPVKPEVQIRPEQQNHDPRPQRSFNEELRRDPLSEKYVQHTVAASP